MSRKLQKFGLNESRYERINNKWECGWAKDGYNCPLGPGKNGTCHSTYECKPSKKGDRWVCNRPAFVGGSCESGPRPDGTCACPIPTCQPSRTIRSKRGIAVLLTAALTLGILLAVLGSPYYRTILKPGEVGLQHGTIQDDCASCHVSAMSEAQIEAHAGLDLQSGLGQTKLCLECHRFGDHGLFPHSMDPQVLAVNTQEFQNKAKPGPKPVLLSLSQFGPGVPTTENGELACSTCHHEHQGTHADLTRLTNQQCQTCHTSQFHSFTEGHPEYQFFPYNRRTRIQFNHISHMNEHFPSEDNTVFQCIGCHQPEPQGREMIVNAYEVSCAGCHQKEMQGKEYAFLSVPRLDLKTLSQNNIDVGTWPKRARGSLTPFMRYLLSQNASVAKDLNQIHDLDLSSLSQANESQVQAASRVAWAIKQLFYNISTYGQQGLASYLVKSAENINHPLGEEEIGDLMGNLPKATLQKALDDWFPMLQYEVTRRNENIALVHPTLEIPTLDVEGLAQKRIPIGVWPTEGTGAMSPLLTALLSVNPEVKTALDTLSDSDLTALGSASKKQLQATQTVAWEVKTLFAELVQSDRSKFQERIAKGAASLQMGEQEQNLFASMLSDQITAKKVEEWFPDLTSELERHQKGQRVFAPRKKVEEAPAEEDFDLDAILSEDEEEASDDADLAALLAEDEGDSTDDADLAALLAEDEGDSTDDADLAALLSEDEEDSTSDDELADLLGDDDEDLFGEDESDEGEEMVTPEAAYQAAEWAASGGWFMQGHNLLYRASGHANPFLKSWFDLLAHPPSQSDNDMNAAIGGASSILFDELSGFTAGKCTKCHGADALEMAGQTGVQVQWWTRRPNPNSNPFTVFSHRPHFSLGNEMSGQNDQGCMLCHQLDQQSVEPYQASFEDNGKVKAWIQHSEFTTNFHPMTKATCAECHTSNGAGDACLACHNYHVGDFLPAFLTPAQAAQIQQ